MAAKVGVGKAPPSRLIIGIDPGLASTGWGLVEARGSKLVHIAHGEIRTAPSEPRSARLLAIFNTVEELLDRHKPAAAAMEALYFAKNITSAFPVAEARGVILLAFARAGLEVTEYSPPVIKQAIVGTGRAEKRQVQEFVKLLLGLKEIPASDHAADALAAAICRHHGALTDKLAAAKG